MNKMGCSFCDDCADCTVGGGLDCSEWDPAEHRGSFYDDDWYDDWHEDETGEEQFSRSTGAEECDQERQVAESRCASCGEDIQPGWNYCIKCGTAVFAQYCTGCGKVIAEEWNYCPACGRLARRQVKQGAAMSTGVYTPLGPGSSWYDDDIPW